MGKRCNDSKRGSKNSNSKRAKNEENSNNRRRSMEEEGDKNDVWEESSCPSKNRRRRMEEEDGKGNDVWEESSCPICMDHPHKAVLLICSSHHKGCRPYLCGTSHLLSNCFDRFCEFYSVKASTGWKILRDEDQPNEFVGSAEDDGGEPICPLCRGQISGWIVVEGAREFMNKLVRGCAMEECDFSGNYLELKEHAKDEHGIDHIDDTVDYDSEEEDDDEADVVPLRPGNSFFDHIHFGDPKEETLDEKVTIRNGILSYTRTTPTATYTYSSVLGL